MTSDDLAALRHQLIQDEGMRLFPYTDSVGRLTIGIGRNLTDRGISQTEAMDLLDNDIALAVSDLNTQFPWSQALGAPRRSVLIQMIFNLGLPSFAGFVDMIASVKRGDYSGASKAMLDSEWARQVGARATRLAAIMASGGQ
jgi:lysozyme